MRTAPALALLASLTGCSLLSLDNLDSAPSKVQEVSNGTTNAGAGGTGTLGSGGAGDGGSHAGGAGEGGAGLGGAGDGGAGGGGVTDCVADAAYTALDRGGSCYRRSKAPATWLDARDRCAELGGGTHLATLTTTADLDIHEVLYPEGCTPLKGDNGNDPCDERAFIGASLDGTLGEDPWDWVTGEEWEWPNGASDPWTNPDEPNEAYLALWIDGTLDGRPNDKSLPYLCETPPE